MNILILVTDYPDNNGKVSLMYIHTRNVEYVKHHSITVLNFSAVEDYVIDGINVITEKTYYAEKRNYDLILSHAANLRMHYRFLKKNKFENVIFFFHGHEVLKINKVYPKPYSYNQTGFIKRKFQDFYDGFKCRVWRKYFKKNISKCRFVFVSKWMKNEFEKWVMSTEKFADKTYITYNGISEEFENETFDLSAEKQYDCITIRSFLDGSKYCVDLVCRIAEANPDLKFCLIGKGKFFEHYNLPANVDWRAVNISHSQIVSYLNRSKCALMPTRTDAQGLMACEMASFGMPLITSDIEVCHEIFDDFENVKFIDNGDESSFRPVFDGLIQSYKTVLKNDRYYKRNTIDRELRIFAEVEDSICKNGDNR